MIGKNAKGNALLCYAYGETDRPCVALVTSVEALRTWLTENMGDVPEENARIVAELSEHDWEEDGPAFEVPGFEIGGMEFTDVFADLTEPGREETTP